MSDLKWISVKEKEPEGMTSLWVTDGHSCAEAYCWDDGKIESAYDTFDTIQYMKEITHFIQLPKPPNK